MHINSGLKIARLRWKKAEEMEEGVEGEVKLEEDKEDEIGKEATVSSL